MKTKHIITSILAVGTIAMIIKNKQSRFNPPKIFYVKTLAKGYNARTIPPFGIYILESQKNNKELLAHEIRHWRQYQKLGLIRFYYEYASQMIQFGYDKMPLEIQARTNESEYCKNNYTECVRKGISKTVNDPYFRM